MSIAIITPIYQHTQHLRKLLDSVLWQLHEDDVLILCCVQSEMSEIGTALEKLIDCPSPNVFLVSDLSGYISCARQRNSAIDGRQQEWLKFLDADDVLAPFALETFRQMKIPETVHCIAGGAMKVVDGSVRGFGIPDWKNIEHSNPAVPSMTFLRRTAFKKVNGFNPQIGFEEDWDLWLRLRREFGMGCFATVQWPVCYYWIDQAERARRSHIFKHTLTVPDYEGGASRTKTVDVREYFAKTYGITPIR